MIHAISGASVVDHTINLYASALACFASAPTNEGHRNYFFFAASPALMLCNWLRAVAAS